jgi:hypothetical protein
MFLTINWVMQAMAEPGRVGTHGSERCVEADQYH